MMLRRLIAHLGLMLCLFLPFSVQAQGYNDDVIEYADVVPAQPTRSADKIEVIEFFWYGCPACYALEPSLEHWLKNKPDDVEFIRIPAVLPPSWELLARAFYTAEALRINDRTHGLLFDAIHSDKRRFQTAEALADFYAGQGVDRKKFIKTFNSFAITGKVRRAKKLTQRYGTDGVPTLIVNGKYRTGLGFTGSTNKLMSVIDKLIERERRQR